MTLRKERDLAWIGDAVLALYAREWLLKEPKHPVFSRQERFIQMTSNDFLNNIGEPTRVEAEIGQIYQDKGLDAAFAHIENTLYPLFRKHLQNKSRGKRGQKRQGT